MKILWRLGKEAIRHKKLYIIAINHGTYSGEFDRTETPVQNDRTCGERNLRNRSENHFDFDNDSLRHVFAQSIIPFLEQLHGAQSGLVSGR